VANTFDAVWQPSYMRQVGQFFCDDAVRDRYLKVFATHAREDRSAFFGFSRVLISEIEQREARVADMQAFPKPVKIIFGAEPECCSVCDSFGI